MALVHHVADLVRWVPPILWGIKLEKDLRTRTALLTPVLLVRMESGHIIRLLATGASMSYGLRD